MSGSVILNIDPEPAAGPAAAAVRPDPRAPADRDVWSRTEPRYRVRAIVLLFVNLALFCGLCVFTFWLREARLYDFTLGSYLAPAAFWSGTAPSLDDFLTEPINVERTPLHAVVLGLLFGALVTVPISIAILYRFPCALPFVLAVVVFAHMPWFALMLATGCMLASVRPFRLNFRYGAALVGLLPVVAYLLFAGGRSGDAPSASSPAHLTLLAAPWVLTILAAAAMLAVILQFARWVDYRPGTVAPAVAVMFAMPVLLFHAGIGIDELDYRVLERRYGPHSELAAPRQDARPMLFGLLRKIVNDPELLQRYEPDVLALSRGEPLANPRRLLNYFTLDFMRSRAEAYEAFRKFLHDYPTSKYVPAALYLQARVLDTRLDEQQLHLRLPVRELYSDYPHAQSQDLWEELLRRTTSPELTAVAALRLGQQLVRGADVEQARQVLRARLERDAEARLATQPADRGLLTRHQPEDSLALEPGPYLLEARRLLELLDANHADPRYGDAPLVDLVRLDPRRPQYHQQVLRLMARYPDALLHDNLLVTYAASLPDPDERATGLDRLAERLAPGDARPEALFRLANLELDAAVETDDPAARAAALQRLEQTIREAPRSVWAAQARGLLLVYAPRRGA